MMSQQINLTPGGPFAVRGAVEKCVSSGGEGLPPHLTGRVTVVPGGGALAIACNSFGARFPQGSVESRSHKALDPPLCL